jgi:hypothetical protein
VSRKLKMSGKDACKQETKETWSIKQWGTVTSSVNETRGAFGGRKVVQYKGMKRENIETMKQRISSWGKWGNKWFVNPRTEDYGYSKCVIFLSFSSPTECQHPNELTCAHFSLTFPFKICVINWKSLFFAFLLFSPSVSRLIQDLNRIFQIFYSDFEDLDLLIVL